MSFGTAQTKVNRSKRKSKIRIQGGSDKSRAEEHLMAKLREAQKENGDLLKEIREKELVIETLEAQLHDDGRLEVDEILSTRTRYGSVQYQVVWKGTKWEKKEVLLELGYEEKLKEFDLKKQKIQSNFMKDPQQYMRGDSDFQRLMKTLTKFNTSTPKVECLEESKIPIERSYQKSENEKSVSVPEANSSQRDTNRQSIIILKDLSHNKSDSIDTDLVVNNSESVHLQNVIVGVKDDSKENQIFLKDA